MSFLSRFRRNRSESDDSSYYKDEPTTSRLTAVLFGFFALFVTLLIAGGLFFGGRAVYRALNGTPVDNTTEQNKQGEENQNKQGANPAPSSDSGNQNSSSSDQSNPSTQPATGDTPSDQSTPSNVPSTGDTPSSTLPRTGDEGL